MSYNPNHHPHPRHPGDDYLDKEMSRLQREIKLSDKKQAEKNIKSPKHREALLPLQNALNVSRQSRLGESKMNEEDKSRLTSISDKEKNNRQKVMQNLSVIMNKSFESSDDFKYILKKIFVFYVSFGDRLNATHLKANKLYKMMHDSYIMDENITKKNLDILFCKHSKNAPSIDFERFLSLILNIAAIKYPSLEPKEAFFELFNNFLKPLYNNLYTETDLGEFDVISKQAIDTDVIQIISHISPVISKLYRSYFDAEFSKLGSKETRQKSEAALLQLLKDFDICPALTNVSVAYSLMQEILDTPKKELTGNVMSQLKLDKDEGREFTLSRFLVYLAKLSNIAYSKIEDEQIDSGELTQAEKLLMMLERMEFSNGFINFEKKICTTHNASIALVPSREFMTKLYQNNPIAILTDNDNSSSIHEPQVNKSHMENRLATSSRMLSPRQTTKRTDISTKTGNTNSSYLGNRSKTPTNKSILNTSVEFKPNTAKVFEHNKNFLQNLFKSYCTHSGGMDAYKMKSIRVIKMMKDANILKVNILFNLPTTSKEGETPITNSPNKRASSKHLRSISKDLNTKRRQVDIRDLDLFIVRLISSNPLRSSTASMNKSCEFLSPTHRDEEGFQFQFKAQGKLEFNQFLKIIEFVAIKLYPELDDDIAIQCLIEKHLANLIDQDREKSDQVDTKGYLKKLMELLKNQAVIDVLGKLKKSLHPYFIYYCKDGDMMNFEQFLKFCREFEIFPQILPRTKLMELFYNLASLYPLLLKERNPSLSVIQNTNFEEMENPLIDENLFVEAIALCASEIDDTYSTHILDKLVYLLERMGEASGPKNVQKTFRISAPIDNQKATWEVVNYIKTKYSELLAGNKIQSSNKRNYDFENLFAK